MKEEAFRPRHLPLILTCITWVPVHCKHAQYNLTMGTERCILTVTDPCTASYTDSHTDRHVQHTHTYLDRGYVDIYTASAHMQIHPPSQRSVFLHTQMGIFIPMEPTPAHIHMQAYKDTYRPAFVHTERHFLSSLTRAGMFA